jgi:hypothetical protein
MKPSSRSPRTPSRLSDSVHHQLNRYAIAASAAGVSILALPPPSEAKVVYTKTHRVVGFNGTYNLDLNHDGTVDFIIREWSGGLFAKEAYGNAVLGYASRTFHVLASALIPGEQIGPGRRFVKSGYYGEGMAYAVNGENGTTFVYGPWVNVKNRYLGLKFQIDGKTHYGWARLSVRIQRTNITATLTGYAYETIPHKSILAGLTEGKSEDAAEAALTYKSGSTTAGSISGASRSASLGVLALGAVQARRWRRQW